MNSHDPNEPATTWLAALPELPTDGLAPVLPNATAERASTAKLDRSGTIRRAVERRRFVRLMQAKAAAAEIGTLPEPTETIHGVMGGNFDGFAFVPAVLALAAPAMIERLTIATLGFNRANADDLFEMLDDGRIASCTLVASNYFYSVDKDLASYLDAGLQARGQRCAILRSHAKLLLFEMTHGRAFVWESSANLRSCRNAEQFALSQSRELLDFHRGWLDGLISKAEEESK